VKFVRPRALIAPDQYKQVCSSGFVVLNSKAIASDSPAKGRTLYFMVGVAPQRDGHFIHYFTWLGKSRHRQAEILPKTPPAWQGYFRGEAGLRREKL
jgi:hypothetical protein